MSPQALSHSVNGLSIFFFSSQQTQGNSATLTPLQKSAPSTVNVWTTRVWTVWVHLTHRFFSLNTYCGTTRSAVGWILRYRTSVTEEWAVQRANCKVTFGFSTVRRIGALTLALFKGQLYFFLLKQNNFQALKLQPVKSQTHFGPSVDGTIANFPRNPSVP